MSQKLSQTFEISFDLLVSQRISLDLQIFNFSPPIFQGEVAKTRSAGDRTVIGTWDCPIFLEKGAARTPKGRKNTTLGIKKKIYLRDQVQDAYQYKISEKVLISKTFPISIYTLRKTCNGKIRSFNKYNDQPKRLFSVK